MLKSSVFLILFFIPIITVSADHGYGEPKELKDKLDQVLQQFSSDLLDPGSVGSVSQRSIEKGEKFVFVSSSHGRFVQVSEGEKGGWHYFRNIMDDGTSTSIRSKGILQESESWSKKGVYNPIKEECKFVLGKCEYKIGSKSKTVNTSFKDGVWTHIQQVGLTGQSIRRKVYSKSGILIFSSNFITNDPELFSYTYRAKD